MSISRVLGACRGFVGARLLVALGGIILAILPALAAPAGARAIARVPSHVHGSLTGNTIYFHQAGLKRNFDLVNRVIIRTSFDAAGLPRMTLVFDTYLESFQSDTQPVLPDLIHPRKRLHLKLGGFFAGRALALGPRGHILLSGPFLAEALINLKCLYLSPRTKKPPKYCRRETQHFVAHLTGERVARGSFMKLRGSFIGDSKLRIPSGDAWGSVFLSSRARGLLRTTARANNHLLRKRLVDRFSLRQAGNTEPALLRLAHDVTHRNPQGRRDLSAAIRYLLSS